MVAWHAQVAAAPRGSRVRGRSHRLPSDARTKWRRMGGELRSRFQISYQSSSSALRAFDMYLNWLQRSASMTAPFGASSSVDQTSAAHQVDHSVPLTGKTLPTGVLSNRWVATYAWRVGGEPGGDLRN